MVHQAVSWRAGTRTVLPRCLCVALLAPLEVDRTHTASPLLCLSTGNHLQTRLPHGRWLQPPREHVLGGPDKALLSWFPLFFFFNHVASSAIVRSSRPRSNAPSHPGRAKIEKKEYRNKTLTIACKASEVGGSVQCASLSTISRRQAVSPTHPSKTTDLATLAGQRTKSKAGGKGNPDGATCCPPK